MFQNLKFRVLAVAFFVPNLRLSGASKKNMYTKMFQQVIQMILSIMMALILITHGNVKCVTTKCVQVLRPKVKSSSCSSIIELNEFGYSDITYCILSLSLCSNLNGLQVNFGRNCPQNQLSQFISFGQFILKVTCKNCTQIT